MERDRGKFFVVEGGVASGKTTQLALLSKELGEGWVYYREPGGTVFGELMRSAVQSQMGGVRTEKIFKFILMLPFLPTVQLELI